jgi:hypothetical protein
MKYFLERYAVSTKTMYSKWKISRRSLFLVKDDYIINPTYRQMFSDIIRENKKKRKNILFINE